ncbi:MAG TPA: phenylalanine--tRNA ligase subunit beta [Erysipelotrichaceae bacterium]|nr:phenylalanine--tRNA ligase subunit beta [Erysipelotrichaceae bacterium]
MKITYNWLKQYIDLSDISKQQLADALTKAGHEVEGFQDQAYGTDLIIGQVLSCLKHPNADSLHICQVDVGNETRQIVCGAPNVAAEQKVIVALPGCQLATGEIKEAVVRGEASSGMICSLSELNVDKKLLTEEQLAGIEVLSADAVVGNRDVLNYLGLDDTVYEISLTPNRADCLSIWALAKDIGAVLNKKVTLPDYSYQAEKNKTDLIIHSETEKAPYFVGTVINSLTIRESPKWLKRALNGVGVKSINNVVDISNYVMLETGQPLHFYDLAKIPAKEITVKSGLDEIYTALDGQKYHVLPDDLMITTEGRAIGYAGIMGGEDSKIDKDTKGIIIEAAHFNLVNVRNTSRRLGLFTEAATRFTKGIDPKAAEVATERSIQLLIQLADARNIEETVVFGDMDYSPTIIEVSVKKINSLLGTHFNYEEIYQVFKALDFQPEKKDEDIIIVYIPSYRSDIKIWQDLSEEVIRIRGYENIVSTLPKMPTTQARYAENGKSRRIINAMLNGYGYSEVVTYSLVSLANVDAGIMSVGTPVRIANAMSEDRRYYRTSLLPSLLDCVSYNVARSNHEYALFETAKVYSDEGKERLHLSLAVSEQTTYSKWQGIYARNDFYTVKGIILNILEKLGYDEKRVFFKEVSNPKELLHPKKSADIYLGRKLLGCMGHIHPLAKKKYAIDETVVAEINLDAIFGEKPSKVKYEKIARYPAVNYDLALVVKEDISAEEIVSTIEKAGGSLLELVEIFDVYRGKGIKEGYKSVAVSISYRSSEKTLSENDIMPTHRQVLDQLFRKLDAVLRD